MDREDVDDRDEEEVRTLSRFDPARLDDLPLFDLWLELFVLERFGILVLLARDLVEESDLERDVAPLPLLFAELEEDVREEPLEGLSEYEYQSFDMGAYASAFLNSRTAATI